MTSSRATTFSTESIDLAAFLVAAGHELAVTCPPGSTRALFVFDVSNSLHADIIGYESGAQLPAKRLLNARSRLFREASQAVRERG